MRCKLLCFVLLLEMFVVSAPTLRATDLRGSVVGHAGPLVGVGVALFEVKPNKTFHLVHQTVTAPDGKYRFNKVHPGQYVLRIGGINYPLEVRDTQMQDIPIIAPPRH
jgi:Carboxypeptidase regulatory-like domain